MCYIAYGLSNCCSTSSPSPPASVLILFKHLQINSGSLVGVIVNSSKWVHHNVLSTLGYDHYWISTGCTTSPSPQVSPPAPPVLTLFEHLQIYCNWLMGMLNWFVLPITSSWYKHALACQWLTHHWLLCFSCIPAVATSFLLCTDPVLIFGVQLWLTCGYIQWILLM
jgi:hypothetical protein